MKLKPWAQVPFELIKHAEEHRMSGGDFDKRIALISYDSAIEASISIYLNLHKNQRGGKNYKKEDVDKWLANYASKIDFFLDEFAKGVSLPFNRDDALHYRSIRNKLYHEGEHMTPRNDDVDGIRVAAVCIFSELFGVNGFDILNKSPMLHAAKKAPIRKATISGSGNAMRKVFLDKGVVTFNIRCHNFLNLKISLLKPNNAIDLLIANNSEITQADAFSHVMSQPKNFCKSLNLTHGGEYVVSVSGNPSKWEIDIEQ